MKLYKFMCAKEVRSLHKTVTEAIDTVEKGRFYATTSESFWYWQGRIEALKEIAKILDEYVIEEV